ncbi:MAG: helix-turn-helix domain-containing protein [Oscillospiraceae bacterium]|nr:helix-turn-helix domain-containing protein [Oscillospiraceae bacterium]
MNNNLGSKIYDLRKKNNMTLEDVGDIVGVGKSTVRKWETGEIANMRRDKIAKLAEALHTTPAYLMGWEEETETPSAENIIPIPKMAKIPLIGKIACGEPITATENLEGFVSAPENIPADFALTCKGDSMIGARILDGDIVLIRQQPDVDDGEIAAVLIDGEATLKRVHKKAGCLILNPANPSYEPIVITGEELADVRIIGKAVYFISQVR